MSTSIKDGSQNRGRDYNFKGKEIRIEIDNDVWIGYASIIASGSVVLEDVSQCSIMAGNTVKVVKKRFMDEEILEHEQAYYKKN